MTIDDILEDDIRFASMMIGYNIYYSSQMKFVSGTAIYVTYDMLRENNKYDLCKLLRTKLIKNLKKIKENKKHPFKYGTLLLCIFFYFKNEISGVGPMQWAFDRPVGVQIQEYLYSYNDSKVQITNLWGYFKNFQEEIHERERILKSIVKKYVDTIYFMVDTDQCLKEAVEPRTSWILRMGYEVDEHILELYAQHLLSQPVDPNEERFGTYKEKSLKLHQYFRKPIIQKKVWKEVKSFAESIGVTNEVVKKDREENILSEEKL